MGPAGNSLLKTNGERNEGIVFSTLEEGVRQAAAQSAGKVLLLSDDCSLTAFATMPKVISLVFDGDALPLFAMPDGVSRVLAAGGEEVMLAARYFAGVRGTFCTLFPSDAALKGVFEPKGEILLDGERRNFPLPLGEVLCDMEPLRPTLGRGYAQILLTRLAKIETNALRAFGSDLRCEGSPLPENEEEIVRLNAKARLRERAGEYGGEGAILAKLLGDLPEWNAFRLLLSLYAAFFEKGKPRRYLLPDYRLRAESAGVSRAAEPPSREEYVRRAMTLERIRASLSRELSAELSAVPHYAAELSRYENGTPPLRGGDLAKLKQLPEHAPCGLSAVIRDFGLMEWKDDEGKVSQRR